VPANGQDENQRASDKDVWPVVFHFDPPTHRAAGGEYASLKTCSG